MGFALFILAALLQQGKTPAENTRKPPLPPEIQAIVDLARTVPPEFAAAALLELQQAGRIPGRDLQREIINEAFIYATRAQEPMPRRALPDIPFDTREIFRGKAYELGMDALSLQSEAVSAMLNVDRRAARELYARVNARVPEKPACEDPLIPYNSAIRLIAPIAQSTFSEKEKEEQEHVRFLTTELAKVSSPGELAGFANAAAAVALTAEQWELMVSAIAAKLESVAADYRTFALSADALRNEIEHIAARGAGRAALAAAFRQYLLNQMKAPRCSEELAGPTAVVEWFNKQFRGDLPPIAEEDIRPERRGEAIRTQAYFVSEAAIRIKNAFERVRFNIGVGPWSAEERRTAEWRGLLSDFLRELSGWQASGERSPIDFFHQKALVLRGLLDLAPRGEDRDRVINEFVALAANSSALREAPMEWSWHVTSALKVDRPRMLEAFRASNNPVLALYVALDRLRQSAH